LSLTFSLAYLLFAAQSTQAAFTIEPALITFFADRGEKTAFVEIVHTGGDPAAIQLSVLERLLDMDGVLLKNALPKSSDFVVHPAQVILYPKERATVQVQYKGKGKITTERAYVLYSQEVPIDVARDKEEGMSMEVKMTTNYYTVISLDVGKPGKLVFVSSKAIGDGKIEVIAENRGAGRVKMDNLNLIVGGKLIKDITGKSNSVMPGTQRRFTFEWPRAVTEKEVRFVY
jgi:P pilus assembly chaperone PapD